MLKQNFIYRFVFIAFLSAVIIFGSIFILSFESKNIKSKIKISEKFHLELLDNSLQNDIGYVIKDLRLLANNQTLLSYLKNKNETNYKILSTELLNYSKNEKIYNQIRFINVSGNEIVRVNFKGKNSYIVKKKNLQNKKDRYYFKNSIKLGEGEIYVSPFDLNVEHGKIELPHKPIVRFCTPVFYQGKMQGILVLNYLGNNFMQNISAKKHSDMLGSIMLINNNGYFLHSNKYKKNEFGFMFENKKNETFQKYYPAEWKIIGKNEEGSFFSDKGLFIYRTVKPINSDRYKNIPLDERKLPKWKLLSFVSQNILQNQYAGARNIVFGMDAFLFIIILFGSISYLRFDKQKKKDILLLIKSEKKFRIFYNSIRDAILIADTNRDIIDCNTAFTSLFGYTLDEVKGKQTKHIYENEEEFKKLGESIKSNYNKNNFLKVVNYKKKTGDVFHGETNVFPLNNDSGEVTGFVSLIRDVSDREKKENALIESEEKFRTAFTTSSDSININRLEDGAYVNINEGFTKIMGFTEDDILGKSSIEKNIWVNPADRERLVKELKRNGEINNLEAEFRKKNGEIVTGLMSAKIINIGGELNILSITRDISNLKAIRIRLEQSEQWHREIFEGSHDAIFVADSSSNFINVNTAAVQLTGFTKSELLKMSIPDLYEEADLTAFNKYFRRILDGEEIINQAKVLCKNGKKVDVEFRNKRIIVDGKTFIHTTANDVTEQNYIENQLRQSEAKFRSIVTNTEEILFMMNNEGIFTLSEGKGLSALGLAPGQVVGQSAYEIYREYPDVINGINRALEGETNFGKIIVGDNYFDIWYSPNKDSDGEIIGMLGMAINRTAQHLAEERLKKSEENLRITLNSIGDAVISIDTNGIITRLNPVAEKLTGYKYEEACGKKLEEVFNIVNAKTAEKVENPVQKVLKNGHIIGMANHTKLISKSGKEYQISDSGSPIKDNKGEIVGVVLIFRDVTKEYNMREAIRESEQQLHLQIERMPIGLIVWDKNFKAKSWNPAAEKIFGYSAEEALGRHPYGMIVPQELQPQIDEVWRRLLEGDFSAHSINENYTKDGNSIICSWTNTPLKNPDGSFIGVLAMVQDITAQHKSEESLKTSELKYRSVIEAIPEAIISVDSSGTIVDWNKTAVVMFGYEKFEALGKNITLIMPERFREKHNAGFAAATKNNKLSKSAEGIIELEGKRKNSTVFPIEMTLCNWQIEDEIFFSANIRDITLKKEHEQEIFKLSQVVEQSRVSVVITDLDSNIEYINPYFTKTSGYTLKEAIGKNPRILKSGEHPEEFYKNLYDTITKGSVWKGEFHNKKKNGELYWEEVVVTPIKDASGKIVNYCAIKTNITQRKEIELEIKKYQENLETIIEKRTAELKKSEETFRALAENSKDSIIRIDNNLKIVYANTYSEIVPGVNKDIIINNKIEDLNFPKKLLTLWTNTIKNVFETKEPNRIEFMLPNGFWIDWMVVPEFDKNKNATTVLCAGRNITKLKKLGQKLSAALEKEKGLNKLKTQFIATVSHEFRTPLTSIFSSVDLLDLFGNDWTEKKKKAQYNQVRNSVKRLTEMLDEVLNMSRLEKGKLSVNYEDVQIRSLIKDVLTEAEALRTPKHKFVPKINLEQKIFYLDKEIIRTVLINLLSNAIKYSPAGGNIEIILKREKIHLLLIVKDEGLGIPEKDLKDIFSEFYRTEKASHIQGTGLGLAIVKRLIEKIDGKIEVESKLGEGSTFTVTIPIKNNKSK